MPYENRAILYSKIEAARNRPLMTYVTSVRPGAEAQIGADVIPAFTRQLLCMPDDAKEVDLLVVSHGGDPTVAWRVVTFLRDRFDKVSVLLPFSAFSAATLLAMGADEIVMHAFGNLGPVDPQLRYRRRVPGPDGQPGDVEEVNFGSEDVRHFLEFLKSDVGISDQEPLAKAFELAIKDVGAIPLGIAKRGTNLAVSMGEKLLSLHMEDKNQAKLIAQSLNSSYYHHGYPVGRAEAESIGLNITKAEDAGIADDIWAVWQDFSDEMLTETPFDPMTHVMQDPQVAQRLTTLPNLPIPANLPQQAQQQVFQQFLQQVAVVQEPPVSYSLFLAAVESVRCRTQLREEGLLNAIRLADLNIQATRVRTEYAWEHVAAE